eukprot:SAG11_NODE_36096_length_263_cov_0.926829_1_plen_40_part_01
MTHVIMAQMSWSYLDQNPNMIARCAKMNYHFFPLHIHTTH